MSFEEYVGQVVSRQKIHIEDSEIDEPDDYKGIIEELFSLSGEALTLNNFVAEEDGDIVTLSIAVNNASYSFEVADQSHVLENKNLIRGLNEILSMLNNKERFYTFWALDSFGQEIGFFYSDVESAEQIFDFAEKHNLNATAYIEQYQISDGNREEGYDDI
ncbi:hypothetical protein L861_01510 [Litchfieldella anticariensis FP35 = DSM 16096]|uniref:Uncharacterized protein n=1 Tax=Litchfieldella anticariensis (strain DSM 16096 / CECT 5854 / CIP 108499 / LMG 22089 / FP35) TaxID=1121939 RepID=S2KTX0_LITA3|nr:hypothetical protein [Halomonas anticariensis]EPC04008.1 hypothetical protein L861_01510 [Halomonas anticariensis FP35 = DSM 16096]